ncbi:MAG: hypothetical protein ACM3JB_24150 [Acidobacteriaceae bacterium]
MNRFSVSALFIILFVVPHGSTISAQSRSSSENSQNTWVLRFDGIGPVKVGMSLSQLNNALQEKFAMPKARDDQGCFVVTSARQPHVSFMLEDGKVTRIDVDNRGIPTDKGIEVGNSEKDVLKVYGAAVKVEPHAYTVDERGHYLTIRNGTLGLRFETSNGKVDSFYAGQFTSVQYIEGCL